MNAWFFDEFPRERYPYRAEDLVDLPQIIAATTGIECRCCRDRIPSPAWRRWTHTRANRSLTLYVCSACYEKMRRPAIRVKWRRTMNEYIDAVFTERRYWAPLAAEEPVSEDEEMW